MAGVLTCRSSTSLTLVSARFVRLGETPGDLSHGGGRASGKRGKIRLNQSWDGRGIMQGTRMGRSWSLASHRAGKSSVCCLCSSVMPDNSLP